MQLFFTIFYNSVPESELRPGSFGFSVSCDHQDHVFSTKDKEEQHQVFSHYKNNSQQYHHCISLYYVIYM